MKNVERSTRTNPTTQSDSPNNKATRSPTNAVKVARSDDPTFITWWKRLLYQERRRHGQVETILTRQINQLEKQIEDLQQLYFNTLSITTSSKGQN